MAFSLALRDWRSLIILPLLVPKEALNNRAPNLTRDKNCRALANGRRLSVQERVTLIVTSDNLQLVSEPFTLDSQRLCRSSSSP
jgi:hypothetical protein